MHPDNLKWVGDFLRAKRESISPEAVGLPRPARTRTTGLRREDVADLSGISTVWYSKIERGQAAGISAQAFASISSALRLTKSEREYLHNLIFPQTRAHKAPCQTTSAHTLQLLTQLNPLPALLANDYLDIVAYNDAFQLMIGFDLNDLPAEAQNYLHLTITHPEWKRFACIDSEETLALRITRMAGFLRDTLAKRPNDDVLKQRICAFKAQSPLFDIAWSANTVLQPEEVTYTYRHAQLGIMALDKQLWWHTNGNASSRLNVYYPQHDADFQRLQQLVSTDADQAPAQL